VPPRCHVCFASFPPCELGDWLAYERAEPEWTLGEWLGVQTSQFSLPSPREAFTKLAQRELQSAAPALPSSRLQKLSAFRSARVFDERQADAETDIVRARTQIRFTLKADTDRSSAVLFSQQLPRNARAIVK